MVVMETSRVESAVDLGVMGGHGEIGDESG